jgi:hypothetical protein
VERSEPSIATPRRRLRKELEDVEDVEEDRGRQQLASRQASDAIQNTRLHPPDTLRAR